MKTLHGQDARDKVWDLIKDIKFALMATHKLGGGDVLHARPMMALNKSFDDGVLWFFTGADTEKAAEIAANPSALLTYAEPKDQAYVSITGKAEVVRDKTKIDELWSEWVRAWFPDGKDDPNLFLVRFDATEAEFWDSPNGVLVNAYGYLKAVLTHEMPKVGETGKVTLEA